MKLNGQRVELEEISGELLRLEMVAEAAVVPVSKEDGSMELRAFIVPRQGRRIEEQAVKAALAERLPVYMIPNALRQVESMPLTKNGKTDRKALLGGIS